MIHILKVGSNTSIPLSFSWLDGTEISKSYYYSADPNNGYYGLSVLIQGCICFYKSTNFDLVDDFCNYAYSYYCFY